MMDALSIAIRKRHRNWAAEFRLAEQDLNARHVIEWFRSGNVHQSMISIGESKFRSR